MSNRVVITGLGSISALGLNSEAFWQAIKTGQSGIDILQGFAPGALKMALGAQVK